VASFLLILHVPSPVAGYDCGDVVQTIEAGQFYAPLSVVVSYLQTNDHSGNWASNAVANGLTSTSTTASFNILSNSMTFNAYGNDTYSFWFSASYPTTVVQTINVTVQEGDRPPRPYHYCMNGTSFYLGFVDQSVVTEPHPLSSTDVGQAVYPELAKAMTSVGVDLTGMDGSINLLAFLVVILIIVESVNAYQSRKLRKQIGG